MTLSIRKQIAMVKCFIRKIGWRVDVCDIVKTFGDDFSTTNGGVIRDIGTVYIKHKMRPRKTLLVLLHEAGHAVAYNTGCRKRHPRAEKLAMLYGAAIAAQLGIPLDPKEWREFNWEATLS